MDDWTARNAGNTVAGGDGAFERFITAAVAAIITIMFSWRLLAEQGEGGEEGGAVGGMRVDDAAVQVRGELEKELSRYKQQQQMAATTSVKREIPKINVEKGEGVSEGKSRDLTSEEEPKIQDISLDEFRINNLLSQEALKKWPSMETNDVDSGFDSNRWVPNSEESSPVDSNSNRDGQVNSAFKDFMNEEFHAFNEFDPFGNSDPFDDNIEPRVLDSDEEMYCCNMLETIMEEDSDEIPSSGSDTESLKRFDHRRFRKEELQSDSDADSLKHSENETGSLKRYVTRKLESDELLEAVVPEQTTNEISDSDEDDEESGSSTSHVTLFTRETISITDSDGNLERKNVVHKVNVPVTGDCTLQQLMSRVPPYPIEQPEETNSSGSDESIVTVLTRQNSTSTIDSTGSPKMIENVTSMSSAFPAFAPGNHGDEYRPDDNSGTRQPDAGKHASITAKSPFYNNSACNVTKPQVVRTTPSSSWSLGVNDKSEKSKSLDENGVKVKENASASVTPVTGNEAPGKHSNGKHASENESDPGSISGEATTLHDSQHVDYETSYKQRISELFNRHNTALASALQHRPLVAQQIGELPNVNDHVVKSLVNTSLSRDNRIHGVTGDIDNSGRVQTSESNVIDNNSEHEKRVKSEHLVKNSGIYHTNNKEDDTNNSQKSVQETSDRVKYIDAYESTAVKNSPQSFTFTTCKSQFVDYHQKNYTQDRDPDDIQTVEDNLEQVVPIPVPRKRLSIGSKVDSEPDSEPVAKLKKSEESQDNRPNQRKWITPIETDLDFVSDNVYDVNSQLKQNRYLKRSDTIGTEITVDRSFDDDDVENIACLEEVIGSIHSDGSPKPNLETDIDKRFESPGTAKKARLETNIDDVFENNNSSHANNNGNQEEDNDSWGEELVEVYDETTGLWVLQTPDGATKEYLNDVPGVGESEREIFLRRCIRQSNDDEEPVDFLDFSRGVEESPPDGGSPVRTSSPLTVINDRPKTSFRILSPSSVEPVLQEASEKLTRRASVEDSPVVKITAQKPVILKDKPNVKNSITKSGESSPVRPKQQTVARRQKSRETTFGPEPNLSSKETTFGPEPPQSSIKETTFGAEPEKPKPKAKETTFSPSREEPKPKVKETTFSSSREKRQSNGDSLVNGESRHKGKDNSKRTKPEQSHSVKFQEVKTNEHKGKFYERVKPKNLDLDVKTHTTLERDNPFRINTPDRQKNANFNIQVNNSPEDVNISSKSKEVRNLSSSKETLIDDPIPVSRESKETNIDEQLPSIDTDNPFREATLQEHIESTYQIPESSLITDKGPFVKIKVKETVIDDPVPSILKETAIDEPAPEDSNEPKKSKAVDHRSPTIEYRPSFQTLSSSSSKETLIDEPSPVIQLPRKQVQETSIDEPSPTFDNKNTPVRKSSSRETLIDEPSPVIKLPSKNNQRIDETRIGAPTVFVQSSPIVTSPTIQSPTIKLPPAKVSLSKHLSKSKETLIDDPSPSLDKHSAVQIRASKETLIDDPAPSIETGPVLKPPTKPQQASTAGLKPHQNYKETSIDDPLPDIHVPTPHSRTTLIDSPSIKLEASPSVKPPPKETSIDEPTQSFQSTIHSPSITLPQKSAKKEIPGKVTDSGIDWQGVQLPSKVKETLIDEPVAVVQTSPIVKPPPKETSIDDDPIISSGIDTSTNISVQSSQITETLIDPPDNELRNKSLEVPRRPIETSIDEPGVNAANPAAKGTQYWESTTDDISLDSNSLDAHHQDSLPAESPRSSVTSFSTSVSSVDQGLTIDTRSRIKLKPNPVDQNFISGDLASPNSHPSDIDDHNVTGPTSPEITSSEDWNNSYDSYDFTSQSQADDSAGDSSLSEAQRKPRSLRQIKRKIAQHRAYKSALHSGVPLTSAQLSAHTNREDIIASRLRFLSEGNLSKSEQQEHQKRLFDDYKKHLLSPLPKIGTFQPNKRYRSKSSFSSIEKLQHITDLYASRIESDESFSKPHVHELHKNCILSPEGRREIHDKTLSIENLNLHLRNQFGSATSLQDTDLDTWKTSGESGFPETDLDFSLYLQQPSDRAVSMTDLRSERIPRKSGNRRFADRHLAPKSKSLQTLETNIDDEDDDVFPDTISRTPSVHELRVTKSLSKLNVPDWYKHSNLTKSASTILRRDSTSTMSSFGYSAFSPSIISSPCPSVTSQSGNVVIKTRVTPSSSSRIFRKYTPATAAQEEYRRSVLNNKSKSTPNVRLPSEKFREKEKPKGLMPVPILSFKQLRAMFEAKAANAKAEKKDTEKPQSPELGKKEQLVIPTVTFSDDESAPESPKHSESSSPRPTSPVSPSSPTRPGPPEIQTATVKAPTERRLPKPILKISEHFARVTKSKTVSEPPRVKTPEPTETIIPASNIEVEATINIPESAVIKRPVTEITEVQRVPDTNSRPEPKPRSFDSTTRTPESNPPPPSVNVSNSNDKTSSSVNNDKPAAIRLGNSNNQSHKIQPVPSTSLFARAKASFTSGRSVKETTV